MSGLISAASDYVAAKLAPENLIVAAVMLLTVSGSALYIYWRAIEPKTVRSFFQFLIPIDVLAHPSARADFLFWITRRAIMPFLLFPAGVTFVAGVGYLVNRGVGTLLGIEAPVFGPPGPVTIGLFTLSMLLAYDLSYYLYHYAQHKVPLLWELHKVHHSAEVLVGITKDRVHPFDELMNRVWDGVIPGLCFGLWTLLSLNPVEVTIFGVNVYVMRNLLMMDFVRHTHLNVSFGAINCVVLCPHWHQLHHSTDPKHFDKNFGLMFSFWDRLFGTLCVPEPDEQFSYGLIEHDRRRYQSLTGLYVLPLQKMGQQFARLWRRRPEGADVAPEQSRS